MASTIFPETDHCESNFYQTLIRHGVPHRDVSIGRRLRVRERIRVRRARFAHSGLPSAREPKTPGDARSCHAWPFQGPDQKLSGRQFRDGSRAHRDRLPSAGLFQSAEKMACGGVVSWREIRPRGTVPRNSVKLRGAILADAPNRGGDARAFSHGVSGNALLWPASYNRGGRLCDRAVCSRRSCTKRSSRAMAGERREWLIFCPLVRRLGSV